MFVWRWTELCLKPQPSATSNKVICMNSSSWYLLDYYCIHSPSILHTVHHTHSVYPTLVQYLLFYYIHVWLHWLWWATLRSRPYRRYSATIQSATDPLCLTPLVHCLWMIVLMTADLGWHSEFTIQM